MRWVSARVTGRILYKPQNHDVPLGFLRHPCCAARQLVVFHAAAVAGKAGLEQVVEQSVGAPLWPHLACPRYLRGSFGDGGVWCCSLIAFMAVMMLEQFVMS
jgi:hypothetical protein